jgi:microcystin-dependent protein
MARTSKDLEELIGAMIPFSGTTVPDGWLLCDGSAVNRSQYPRLFAAIGTAHGQGNGSTTFHLPDLRGRFCRGTDLAAGRDSDSGTRTAANTGGNTGDNVGSVQADALQHHMHGAVLQTMSGPSSSNSVFTDTSGSDTVTRHRLLPSYSGNIGAPTNMDTRATIQRSGNGTPRTSSETRPINVNLNYIIKY